MWPLLRRAAFSRPGLPNPLQVAKQAYQTSWFAPLPCAPPSLATASLGAQRGKTSQSTRGVLKHRVYPQWQPGTPQHSSGSQTRGLAHIINCRRRRGRMRNAIGCVAGGTGAWALHRQHFGSHGTQQARGERSMAQGNLENGDYLR